MSDDMGVLSPLEAALTDPVLSGYVADTIERQVREELRAAEGYVKFEHRNLLLWFPTLNSEQYNALQNYADALAKRECARRKLEQLGFKP